MIKFHNVSKYYPTRNGRSYVLRDVNMEIPTDRNVAVLGPNGAGKSTLIRMLGGVDFPTQGRIETDARISWPLGLQGGLQGSMTGRENVRFVARIHGERNLKLVESQVAEFAGIGRYFDEPVKHYSNGMRARIAFGLTLGFDFHFDVLLIDELGAVGDASFKKKSKALLQEKYEETKVFLVNHSLPQLISLCDSAVMIKDQKLHFFDDVSQAVEKYLEEYVK